MVRTKQMYRISWFYIGNTLKIFSKQQEESFVFFFDKCKIDYFKWLRKKIPCDAPLRKITANTNRDVMLIEIFRDGKPVPRLFGRQAHKTPAPSVPPLPVKNPWASDWKMHPKKRYKLRSNVKNK